VPAQEHAAGREAIDDARDPAGCGRREQERRAAAGAPCGKAPIGKLRRLTSRPEGHVAAPESDCGEDEWELVPQRIGDDELARGRERDRRDLADLAPLQGQQDAPPRERRAALRPASMPVENAACRL
jgi:hypothetical protein